MQWANRGVGGGSRQSNQAVLTEFTEFPQSFTKKILLFRLSCLEPNLVAVIASEPTQSPPR